MPVQFADVEKALDLKYLKIPAALPVLSISAEEYADSTGDEALKLLVVIDESVDAANAGREVGELKSNIRESLRNHGITLFPYVFLAKPSELEESDDED